jgi:hypothetical protein
MGPVGGAAYRRGRAWRDCLQVGRGMEGLPTEGAGHASKGCLQEGRGMEGLPTGGEGHGGAAYRRGGAWVLCWGLWYVLTIPCSPDRTTSLEL